MYKHLIDTLCQITWYNHLIIHIYIYTSSARTSRGRKFPLYKKTWTYKNTSAYRKKSCTRPTRPLNDMFAALESSTDVFDCDSIDALQHRLPKKRRSWAIGCNEGNAQPTAACCPQRHRHCKETTFLGIRMQRRQCAAHSGVRIAKKRSSWAHNVFL